MVICEAMEFIQEKGLIESHLGRGAIVTDNIALGGRNSFDFEMRMNPDCGSNYLVEKL